MTANGATTTIEIKNYFFDDEMEEDVEDSDFEDEEPDAKADEFGLGPDEIRSVLENNIKYTDNAASTVATDFIHTPTAPTSIPKNGTGLQMLVPGPSHINMVPDKPEEINKINPTLLTRLLLDDAQRMTNQNALLNRVVYDCIDPSPMYSNSSANTTTATQNILEMNNTTTNNAPQPRQELKQYYVPINKDDTTLFFESRFESGNLRRAIQVYEREYDLILKFDVNTRGHTQWFYFSVRNARKGQKYKFNIINLVKPDSLYNFGMKPLVYSEQDAASNTRGWYRHGTDICYYQNNIKRKSGYFYTFTWSYVFENDNDTYYFAYCYPYTYTNLQNYLNSLEQDTVRRKLFRRRTLCQTLAGNNCDLLTITSFSCDPQALKNRKGVVVSARVHPGESNSSWMMKGVIDFLTGPSLDAKILRDNFVFKIVPMLNPDGVINGNYRCSLAGVDLNRRWLDPSAKLCPTIHHTKLMVKRFMEDRDVIISCDFHGHSRKKNIFMYGCHDKSAVLPEQRLAPRVFPRILWKISHNFSFQDCNFSIHKSKESTARVVLYKEFGLVNSYTLEASFCGPDFGRNSERQFNTRHLEQMGHFFCESILDYCDPDQTRVKQVIRELELLYPATPPSSDGDGSNDSSGSDSEDSEGGGKKRKKKKKKRKKKKDVLKDNAKKDVKKDAKPVDSKKKEKKEKKKSAPQSAQEKKPKQIVVKPRPTKSAEGTPATARGKKRDSSASKSGENTPVTAVVPVKEKKKKKKKVEPSSSPGGQLTNTNTLINTISTKLRSLELEDRGSLTDDGTNYRNSRRLHYNMNYLPDGKQRIRYSTDDDIEYSFKHLYESEAEEEEEYDGTIEEEKPPPGILEQVQQQPVQAPPQEEEKRVRIAEPEVEQEERKKSNPSNVPSARRRAGSNGSQPKRSYEEIVLLLNAQMSGTAIVPTSRATSPTPKRTPTKTENSKPSRPDQSTLPRLVNAMAIGASIMKPPKPTKSVPQQRKTPGVYDGSNAKVISNPGAKTPTKNLKI